MQRTSRNRSRMKVVYVKCHSTTLKPGFHYPNWRPEFTGRELGPWTLMHFLTPVNSGRVHTGVKKCTRVRGPSTRPVKSAVNSGNGFHFASWLATSCQLAANMGWLISSYLQLGWRTSCTTSELVVQLVVRLWPNLFWCEFFSSENRSLHNIYYYNISICKPFGCPNKSEILLQDNSLSSSEALSVVSHSEFSFWTALIRFTVSKSVFFIWKYYVIWRHKSDKIINK